MKIQADTANGVYEVVRFDGDTMDVVDFLKELPHVRPGETVRTEADENDDTLRNIARSYGIRILYNKKINSGNV